MKILNIHIMFKYAMYKDIIVVGGGAYHVAPFMDTGQKAVYQQAAMHSVLPHV
jgi:hypothetical protein